ncbi:substrate-binding periplasmic protein [Paucibacter sp. Y2R2-4]|uniref:substrate-binding periplasmic protein n=1 Tax=Paucibacter sp. Y2R2-4 TaxID=2893553 RepID=UPI0021E481AC|nr:transporter substrate-binding domain-containing protein [Paucibacter sp. Y2R2-4]MCV2350124.1 transporter substrate-binding domain-containing protein [Paucibacter sp. Y2R2-4]
MPICVGDFPPFNSPKLPKQGPVIEITTEAFKRLGYEIQTQFMPWARILKEGEDKNCLVLGMWRNAQREQVFNFSLPIVQQELGFFIKRESKIKDWREPGLLQQQLIGVERASYLPPALQEPGIRLDPSAGIKFNLQKLARDRIQLTFGNKDSGLYIIKNEPDLQGTVRWLPPGIERKDTYLACAKNHPEQEALLDAFNQGLRSMRADGSFQKILREAGLSSSAP